MKKLLSLAIMLFAAIPATATANINFSASGVGGLASATGNFVITNRSVQGQYVRPVGSTGFYYATTTGSSTITLKSNKAGLYNTVEFLHGSIDSYNSLQVFDKQGDLLGSFGFLGNGNQSATGTALQKFILPGKIGSVKFNTTQPAFEIDDLKFYNSAVPEPATWLSMVLGLGIVGLLLRNKYLLVRV